MMKKYLVLATLFLVTSTASAANITWHGGVDYRYNKLTREDNLGTTTFVNGGTHSTSEIKTTSHMYKANLGATGGWDNIEWGITVGTTGSAGKANSRYTTINNNTLNTQGDLTIGLEDAWFRYGNDWGFGDIGFTFGRQSLPFAMGSQQTFIDEDVRMDGFSQTWKWGSFGLNLGQYYLGGVNGNALATGTSISTTPANDEDPSRVDTYAKLFGYQATFNWRFNDDFSMLFGAGYYHWAGAVGTKFQNLIPNSNTNTTAGSIAAIESTRVSVENSGQWQFLLDFDLPYMLNLEFEIVFNKEHLYGTPVFIGSIFTPANPQVKLDSTAWSLGLSYGELKKAHDFTIGYAYSDKGLGSVYSEFTYEFNPAGYDGHTIWAGYNIANNFNIGLKFIFLDEKNPRTQAGVALVTAEKIDRNYWEVSTGVRF